MGSEYSPKTPVLGAIVGGFTVISTTIFLFVLLWGK